MGTTRSARPRQPLLPADFTPIRHPRLLRLIASCCPSEPAGRAPRGPILAGASWDGLGSPGEQGIGGLEPGLGVTGVYGLRGRKRGTPHPGREDCSLVGTCLQRSTPQPHPCPHLPLTLIKLPRLLSLCFLFLISTVLPRWGVCLCAPHPRHPLDRSRGSGITGARERAWHLPRR